MTLALSIVALIGLLGFCAIMAMLGADVLFGEDDDYPIVD